MLVASNKTYGMYKKSIMTVVVGLAMLIPPFGVGAQTMTTSVSVSRDSVQTEIQSLLSRIEALRVEIVALISASGTTGGVMSAPPCYAFLRSLTQGAQGNDVNALQKFLLDRGFAIPAGATGYFGGQTKAALVMWQVKNEIVTPTQVGSGIFGPLSRGMFSRSCATSGTATSTPSVFSFTTDPQSGMAPLAVTFTASAPITSGSSTFSVDFGDKSATVPMTPGSCIAITAIVGGQSGIRCSASAAHTYATSGAYTARLMHDTCPAGAQCFVGPQTVATTVITVSASTTPTTSTSVRLNAPGDVILALGDVAEVRNKNSFFTLTELTSTSVTIQVMPVGCWNSFPSDPLPAIRCMIAIMPVPPTTLTVGQSYEAPNYRITLTSIVNGKATFAIATSLAL